jgi:predicted protein tyrosine phosphatase
MPWIENVSFEDIQAGHHFEPGPNAMLIQIVDPIVDFPRSKRNFREVHRFKFDDVEEQLSWAIPINDEQAEKIANLLVHALDNSMNVVVHCMAGIYRSGAVVQVGVLLGFQDTEKFRDPNTLVMKKLLTALDL